MDKQDFRKIIESQVENERKVVKILRESMKKTANTVIRLMFYQLALDSTKHEQMLRTILELLETPSEAQFGMESEEFRKVMEKHVQIEREMLETFEKIVDQTQDRRAKFILQNLVSDEERHHAVMKRIHELVFEGEKVDDEKWWDFLFRYSRLTA